MKTLIKQQDRQ